ncbi:uncharacterized protein N0V89_005478 [Didymosphaeria variabile]|uniref:Uncharacterized protein n=1 Tax=Didymosphaeria variabile TaxID=1932322 RepID=A0A9W8XMY8_9PLEO|nr:uncharacterized protein N0V89_005478 [Didymosphaeria variabile]KAJ4353748.1 hypothetical protein N0V89_005478 [Didymosphaeria variabile]
MTGMSNGGDDAMDSFGEQYNPWADSPGGTSMMAQVGHGLPHNQFTTGAFHNPAPYPQHPSPDAPNNGRYAMASGANLFAAYHQRPAPDPQMDDQYAMTSDANRGAQMHNPYAAAPVRNPFSNYNSPSPDAQMGGQYVVSGANPIPAFGQGPSPHPQMDNQHAVDSGSNPYPSYNNPTFDGYSNDQSPASSDIHIKREHDDGDYVDSDLAADEDINDEAYSEQLGKKRKINKNGRMRKVRQPRGNLRRWDENDVSRALMGIVWACGENGVQIPFDQAAKLVDQTCTAGALQQAILKIQTKLNKDGEQIPRIKMNWPKKRDSFTGTKTVVRDNGKVPRKKPTLTQATQCNITSLRALPRNGPSLYEGPKTEAELDDFLRGPNNIVDVQIQYAQLPHRPAMSQAATTTTQVASSSTQANTPDSQGLSMSNSHCGQSAASDSARFDHEGVSEFLSPSRHISDLPPSTPVRPHRSPVCPSPPHRPMAARRAHGHLSAGATTLEQRFFPNNVPSSLPALTQQRTSGHNQQHDPDAPADLRDRRLQQRWANDTQLGLLAAFNADFEQRNASSLAQPSSSSNLRVDTSMSRNAAFPTDVMLSPSPINARFYPDTTSQDLGGFQGMTPMEGPSTGFDTSFSPPRKDSGASSGTQSTNSSQASVGSMDHSARAAHNKFQASLAAAAAERTATSMPSRTIRAHHSRQQPRQQLSVGLNTLSNPFGGSFDDAFGNPFSPTYLPGGSIDDVFGRSTSIDAGTGFGHR